MKSLFISLGLFLSIGCSPGASPRLEAKPVQASPRAKNVLVVYNENAPDSLEIVAAYKQARGIPDKNIVAVKVTTEENIPWSAYDSDVRDVVRNYIEKSKLDIDFLVLIKGMPLRLNNDGGYGLDSFLMVDANPKWKEKTLDPMPMSNFTEADFKRVANPYFSAKEPFKSTKYGFYLSTRLDGYTKYDAIALIGRSINAKPAKGEFLLDAAPDKTDGGYGRIQAALIRAKDVLQTKQFEVSLDQGASFIGGRVGLMGYASWGSNDTRFTPELYHSLKFLPGSIAETFVSTSARTFHQTTGGQSLIADLIQQGVTGVKGYASEPYTLALAYVDILFDRYTDGFNLAESFYMASPMLKWKDIVIGDPLCAPYAK